jgi:hypothetical protein
MKTSVKALLWSGLGFPGVGHFYLKHYQRGLIISIPAAIGISLYLRGVLQQVDYVMGYVMDNLDKLVNGTPAPDQAMLEKMAEKIANTMPQNQLGQIAFLVFIVCWAVGMYDAYKLGEQIEKDASTPKQST